MRNTGLWSRELSPRLLLSRAEGSWRDHLGCPLATGSWLSGEAGFQSGSARGSGPSLLLTCFLTSLCCWQRALTTPSALPLHSLTTPSSQVAAGWVQVATTVTNGLGPRAPAPQRTHSGQL